MGLFLSFVAMLASAADLGRAYVRGDAVVPTLVELSAFRRFIRDEFERIPCRTLFIPHDVSLAECRREFSHQGILFVSTAHNYHPFLTFDDNARFRAIHDWHHIQTGADDSFEGELTTFEYAADIAPPMIRWMLFSEIVLQAAAFFHTGEFQPQKLVYAGGF